MIGLKIGLWLFHDKCIDILLKEWVGLLNLFFYIGFVADPFYSFFFSGMQFVRKERSIYFYSIYFLSLYKTKLNVTCMNVVGKMMVFIFFGHI